MKALSLSLVLMISGHTASAYEARITAARVDISGGIKTALEVFAIDCDRYPTTAEGLPALLNCPTNIASNRWHGPYLNRNQTDPWGNDYVYRCPGIHNKNGYDLYSCGADGISKNGGDDIDDINNWDTASPHSGNYSRLSWTSHFLGRLTNSPPLIQFVLVFQVVPLLGLGRLVAYFFSKRIRKSVSMHPTAHVLWFVASVVGFLLLLACIVPRIEM